MNKIKETLDTLKNELKLLKQEKDIAEIKYLNADMDGELSEIEYTKLYDGLNNCCKNIFGHESKIEVLEWVLSL